MFIKKLITGFLVALTLVTGFVGTQMVSESSVVYANSNTTPTTNNATAKDPAANLNGITVTISNGTAQIGGTSISTSQDDAWNKILGKFQAVVMGVSGIGTICMVLFFILNFIKLGAASTNPSEVAKIKTALLYSGLAAAGLGSVAFIVGLFYGFLK